MKEMLKPVAISLGVLVAYAFGQVSANSQLLPPPPVINGSVSDQFTATDRKVLMGLFRMTRAMHTRLFPLAEEQRILNGGTVDLQ